MKTKAGSPVSFLQVWELLWHRTAVCDEHVYAIWKSLFFKWPHSLNLKTQISAMNVALEYRLDFFKHPLLLFCYLLKQQRCVDTALFYKPFLITVMMMVNFITIMAEEKEESALHQYLFLTTFLNNTLPQITMSEQSLHLDRLASVTLSSLSSSQCAVFSC